MRNEATKRDATEERETERRWFRWVLKHTLKSITNGLNRIQIEEEEENEQELEEVKNLVNMI